MNPNQHKVRHMDEDKQAVESRESLSPAQIRQKLQDAVMADLLGPANGPDEIVDEPSVRDRYLIGRLGPQGQRWQEAEQERVTAEQTDGELDVAGADDEDGVADARPPQAVSMQPSSIGLSFVVSGEAGRYASPHWGRYLRTAGARRDIRRHATRSASDPGRGRRRGGCAAADACPRGRQA